MAESDFNSRINQQPHKTLGIEHKILASCIKRFVSSRLYPFAVKNVRQYVYQSMGKYYQYQVLHKMMKEEIYHSYKKCKPRQIQ